MTEPTMWKLLITEGSSRKEIHIESTATLAELYVRADSQSVQLARALPRKDLPCCDKTTLIQAGLQSQDRILAFPKATQPSGTPPKARQSKLKVTRKRKAKSEINEQDDSYSNNNETDNVAPIRRGGSQRAAAKVASASFSETNRLIEERERQSLERPKARSKTNPRAHNKTSIPRHNQHFAAASTTGRRLEDGAVLAAKRPRRSKEQPRTDDPATGLLDAINSSNNSKGARFMRSKWRQAVNDAFEQNKAMSRMAALTGGRWNAVVEGDALNVSFSKGVQGRGDFEEQVDEISEEVLQSLVAAIHRVNPEALRPQNIALLSPRVFWSSAHHYSASIGNNQIDLGQALQYLKPDLDWSFLRRRKEQLSTKARENLRQQAKSGDSAGADWQAAADAIESVEEAMGNLQAFERQSRNTQLANASASRLVSAPFVVTTPSETDLDELRECVSENEATSAAAAERYATSLLESGIHNWRELANCDVEILAGSLLAKTGDAIPTEIVQVWIDAAQYRTVDEIMVEICEGNAEAVQALLECANSGTPKDLAAWRGISDELTNTLKHIDGFLCTSPEILERWCGRAQQALEQLDWLFDFITPISD